MYPSIHPPDYPYINSWSHQWIHPCIPSVEPSILPPSKYQFIHQPIHVSNHPTTHPSGLFDTLPPPPKTPHHPHTSPTTSSFLPTTSPPKQHSNAPSPPSNMIPSRILMCLFPVIWGGWVWPVFILQYCECVSVSTVDVLGHTRSQCVSSPKVRRGHKRHVSFVRIVFFNREHLYNLTLNSLTHILLTYSHHASWHPTCERFWD